MDAILDEALDDLDDDSSVEHSTINENIDNKEQQHEATLSEEAGVERSAGTQLDQERSQGDGDEVAASDDPAAMFQKMFRDFVKEEDDGTDPDSRLNEFMDQVEAQLPEVEPKQRPTAEPKDEAGRALAAILEEMAKAGTNSDINDADVLDEMYQHFEKMEGAANPDSFNPDAVIDGMMEQLLSKDLMYEPMKQVTEKFPHWLEVNRQSVNEEELHRRESQFKSFQKLVELYETEPRNTEALLELMQEVQEFGQPPQEIINEIAPGLEMGEDGMPKANPFGSMPFGENEDCSIM